MMKLEFEIEIGSVLAGAVVALCAIGELSSWWLLALPLMVVRYDGSSILRRKDLRFHLEVINPILHHDKNI